ncbi:GTP-binding protein GEM-like [Saccostrea cucullata]|uniref:GTP-binding protein GEM-like n=1 Tax=Saccostrea cuccullata TaxID=36930 RepID=UPI002ED38C63
MDHSDRFLSPNVAEDHGHHTRSRSFKGRPRPKEHEEHEFRPRRNSMPSHHHTHRGPSPNNITTDGDEEESKGALCRVRSFKTTSKGGIVNRGDSVKRNRHKDHLHVSDSFSSSDTEVRHVSSSDLECVVRDEETENVPFTVVVLGPAGVGKTLLTTQFMTSEYIGTSSDGDGGDKTVTVQLDGEESTIRFIDPSREEEDVNEHEVDAYLVVFSVNDRSTFEMAVETLFQIRHELCSTKAVILVANKIDIVRKRVISSEEARAAAHQYDSKYAETSAALNHHVDELLVGVLSQIRLKHDPEAVEEHEAHKNHKEHRRGSFRIAKGILTKLFRKHSKKDKSCENLYEL